MPIPRCDYQVCICIVGGCGLVPVYACLVVVVMHHIL